MTETMANLLFYGGIAVAVIVLAFTSRWWIRLFGAVVVPDDSIAIVNKKFVLVGSNKTLPEGAIVALNGEAGLQADTLPPGVHWGYWPWQYELTIQKFVVIPDGQIGIVSSAAGASLPAGRVLGKRVECENFQNLRAFLAGGGQRGPQLTVVPPGVYRINTGVFKVQAGEVLEIKKDTIGIVTTKEGAPLRSGDIAGKEVRGHNAFQDAQAFLDAGGFKGLQEQVISAGRYYINPLFASIESKEMTLVPIAHVGVVISYVGDDGQDVSGDAFKHGNLVSKGQKGVWAQPLEPGKYPINPYCYRVENVPTANVVLNWANGKTEAHNLDKNLSTITVRSSDGFTYNLDVSQIIHIPHNDAPKVIARFGTMINLVGQVLEPTIGNYFRNAAQGSDAIEFLKQRSQRQADAKASITSALDEYNVVAVDTLIGDIVPPDALMKTLTDRKIAEQQKVTFDTQRLAEVTRKELEQARATAETQATVVAAERQVSIAEFNAKSSVARAEGDAKAAVAKAQGDAEARTTMASAEAQAITVTGNAEASKTRAIGEAEADVTKQKIASMEAGNFAAVQIAQALREYKGALVPGIVAGGNGNGGSLIDVLVARMLQEQQDHETPKA